MEYNLLNMCEPAYYNLFFVKRYSEDVNDAFSTFQFYFPLNIYKFYIPGKHVHIFITLSYMRTCVFALDDLYKQDELRQLSKSLTPKEYSGPNHFDTQFQIKVFLWLEWYAHCLSAPLLLTIDFQSDYGFNTRWENNNMQLCFWELGSFWTHCPRVPYCRHNQKG